MSRGVSMYLEFARRGRNEWWRYIATPAAGFTVWLALLVGLTLTATVTHLLPPDFSETAKDASHPAVFYSFTGVIFAAFAVAIALAAYFIQGKRPADIIGAWRLRDTATGAGVWLVLCVAGALIDYLVQPGAFHLTFGPATGVLALFAIPSLGAQTFCEEFLFRGYVTQGLLLATKRPLVTAAISGAIFASLHIPNGWPQAAGALLFGIVAAMIAMRTGGLAFTWGMHAANNLFGAILVVSTDDVLHGSPGVFTVSAPDLAWFDAAVSAVAFALIWVVVIRRWPADRGADEQAFA
jgi:membrane protease YdiL (CAAX protease family)